MTHDNDHPSSDADRKSRITPDPAIVFPDAPRISVAAGSLAGSDSAGSPSRLRIIEAAGWMWLGLLVYAPWAYGSTRPWSLQILNLLVFATLSVWAVGCLLHRTRPKVHPVLLAAVALLLLQGWWMTLNSGFSYDEAFQPHARPRLSAALPGAVDHAAAWPTMVGLTGMLGGICVACDLGQHRRWRKRIWFTLAVTGVSIILLGLAQKVTHAPGIFWRAEGFAKNFFGPYRYHANAGALINLIGPIVAAFLVQAIRRGESAGVKSFWLACLIVSIAGALANTSRASGLIAVLMLGGWVTWMAWRAFRQRSETAEAGTAIAAGLLLLALVLVVVGLGGLDATFKRWTKVDQEFTLSNSRLMGAQVCVQMLPQSGWFGFGPGTFRTAFPFFNKDTTDATSGVWLHAHQDYLQTLVEWGWIGGALWALVLPGIVLFKAWHAFRARNTSSESLFFTATLVSLGSVLFHASGDFPLQIASLQLVVVTLTGMLWGAQERRTVSRETRASRRTRRVNVPEPVAVS